VLHKLDGKLVVMGNVPTPADGMGKSLSSANLQSLGPKPAPAQPTAGTQIAGPASAPSNTGPTAKP
jgi:hypothetical protein